jgi:uncharacterized protein YdaU (DUF1376 family)
MSDAKPPAFRFYPADFVMGTATMTGAQIGSYVLMLCHQWDNGHVPDDLKLICRIGKCPASVGMSILESKFPKWEDGLRRNERLERERDKALVFSKSQSNKGSAGAKKRWENNGPCHPPAIAQPMPVPIPEHGLPVSVSVPLSKDKHEREPHAPEADRPGEKEVKDYAVQIGVAEWRALDWLDEMKGGGWLDFNHRPVADWRAMLRRVKAKWEADGRPSQPPSRSQGSSQSQGSSTADKILHNQEYERVLARMKTIRGQYEAHQSWDDADKEEWKKLAARKTELKKLLGITI